MRVIPQRKRKTSRSQAVLEPDEIQRIRDAAADAGPMVAALLEWIYTNGARASEPGLARMEDIDLRGRRVQLIHLKGGLDPDWIPLAARCAESLQRWLASRDVHKEKTQQRDFVFPGKHPGKCYPCEGTGTITKSHRKTKQTSSIPCPHCDACGVRWGITRHEVRHIVDTIFQTANIPEEKRFPHILRHSAVTHMVEKMSPAAVQERVGHASVQTTYKYIKATKAARELIDDVFDEGK